MPTGTSRPMRAGRLRSLTAFGSMLAIAGSAQAHQVWGDGVPVPEWVTRSCCGPADAHRLSPDQVHRVTDGYRIDGYPRVIYDAQVLPSEDGEFWAFYSTYQDANGIEQFSSVYCFFAPSSG